MVDREELQARQGKLQERIARLVALSLLGEPDDFFDSAKLREEVYGTVGDITEIWTGLTAPERDQMVTLLVELGEVHDQSFGPQDREATRRGRAQYRQRLEEEEEGGDGDET
jgi:hypothetical protein